ncbi:hypothetical protein [Algoriphagus litoralis]|uniref:hypothetical protein n=1 Tax=Algoriphagus litoralis TaxID=2202829 RepID=UPI000DB9AC33|nr:hypothetical protein [Algoriphagus litoralis]
MKKQKIALLLSCFWLLSLAIAFSFPPTAKSVKDHTGNQSVLSELPAITFAFRNSAENPEVPGFKADIGLSGFINSIEKIEWLTSHSQYLSPAFFKKSRPLFDVLITFFYFFHTW